LPALAGGTGSSRPQAASHSNPERVARDILRGLRRGRTRIVTGYGSTRLYWLSRLAPNRCGWFMLRFGF
jgi:hypothetical protein